MSGTPSGVNPDNDGVIALDSDPESNKPFARRRTTSRSIASDHVGGRIHAEHPPRTKLPTPSVDSDDSSHIPGPSRSDLQKGRRTTTVVQGSRQDRREKLKGTFEDDIQSVSSSSDVEQRESSTMIKVSKRKEQKVNANAAHSEGDGDTKYQQQDTETNLEERDVSQRKRRSDRNLRSAPVKRRSLRRPSSLRKEDGLHQMKADRQKREANRGCKLNDEPTFLHHRPKERCSAQPIDVEECDEGGNPKCEESNNESNPVSGVRQISMCDDDLQFVPEPQRDSDVISVGTENVSTRPVRCMSEQKEKLSLNQQEVAEEVKELNVDAPYKGPTHLIFEYPRGQKGKIRVTAEERGRLEEKKYLNDSLIDFFFKYQEIVLQQRAPELQVTAKFFSSFFYGRLRRTKPIDYEGVRSWTKDVDIFAKQFVFVPICDSYHWSLIIIANLHNLNDVLDKENAEYLEHERPRIVYLDSLDPSRGSSFVDSIRRYLVEEWLCRKKQEVVDDARKKAILQRFKSAIPLLKAEVPLQTNEYDCGLYVLNSLQMFLKNEGCFMDALLCGDDQVSHTYTHVDIQILRETLVRLMNNYELEWRESTRSASDEAQVNPPEKENVTDHQSAKILSPDGTNHLDAKAEEHDEEYLFNDERIGSRNSSDELKRHTGNETYEKSRGQDIGRNSPIHESRAFTSVAHNEIAKGNVPSRSGSRNRGIQSKIGNGIEDCTKPFRPGAIPAIAQGSLAVGCLPQWSFKGTNACESEKETTSLGKEQEEHSLFGKCNGPLEKADNNPYNDNVLMRSTTKNRANTLRTNHGSESEKDEKNQEMPEGLLIRNDGRSLSFVNTYSEQLDAKFPIISHLSERGQQEIVGKSESNGCSPQNSEIPIEVGYGGNPQHLHSYIARTENPRENLDDSNAHDGEGIDIYGDKSTDGHESRSPFRPHIMQSSSDAIEKLDTYDHIGEVKTYTRHIIYEAPDS